jgi:hypothetical protein
MDMKMGSMTLFTDQTVIERDGWMTSFDDGLLLWIPDIHCHSLHRPSTIKVIGKHETCISFKKSVFGTSWTFCYTHE